MPLGVLASARAGAAWTPASLGSLVAWYDASDAATITSSAGRVSQWADKSGNARHVTQSDSSLRPSTGIRALNGRNVIDFAISPTPQGMWSATGLTIGSATVAVVAKFDAIRTDGSVIVALRNGGGYAPAAKSSPNQWWVKGTSSMTGAGVTAPDLSSFCATTILNGSSSILRVNGIQQLSGNAGTTTGDRIGISSHNGTDSSYGIDGFVAEVVIVPNALTGADLINLETYLKSKWGTP